MVDSVIEDSTSNLVTIGRITSVFGIKGWVKVQSSTEPKENVLKYQPWWLKTPRGVKQVEIDDSRPHGSGLIAHIKGVDDRDEAAQYCPYDIAVEGHRLPLLDAGEFYWHQLIGLAVVSEFEGREVPLGQVQRMLETGANDVLVVGGGEHSIDGRERLIPYIPEQVITQVDLSNKCLRVDWDPDF